MAVKCLDVDEIAGCEDETPATARVKVQGEVNINQLVDTTQCSHVTRYRGHGVRNWEDRIAKGFGKASGAMTLSRQAVFIYQDFAGCGNLDQLIRNHKYNGR